MQNIAAHSKEMCKSRLEAKDHSLAPRRSFEGSAMTGKSVDFGTSRYNFRPYRRSSPAEAAATLDVDGFAVSTPNGSVADELMAYRGLPPQPRPLPRKKFHLALTHLLLHKVAGHLQALETHGVDDALHLLAGNLFSLSFDLFNQGRARHEGVGHLTVQPFSQLAQLCKRDAPLSLSSL